MNFSKENIKQIRSLIVFTLLLLIGLWKYEVVLDILGFVWGIISPFILGGAIAFILNVPMNFIQKNLFEKNKYFQTEKGKKLRDKLENTVSLVITIFLVISILAVVIFVVVPQLGKTFVTLKRNIEVFIPKIMADIAMLFENNPQILGELNGLQLDWNQLNWDNILTTIIDFFPSRCRKCAWKHLSGGKGNCKRYGNILHCICICMLYSSSEKEISSTDSESNVCISKDRAGREDFGCLFIDL